MEKFKDKNTGVIYNVNSPTIVDFFKNNSNYELLKEKKKTKKTDIDNEENTNIEE